MPREVWPEESIGGAVRRRAALSLLLLIVLAPPCSAGYACHFWHDADILAAFASSKGSAAWVAASSAALPACAALAGALVAGLVADAAGRQRALCCADALVFVGVSCLALAGGARAAAAARFFIACGLGAASVAAPLYLGETLKRRGAASGSALAAAAFGAVMATASAGREWRVTLGCLAVLCGCSLAACAALLPDTPLWLARSGALRAAEDVLSALRPPRDASEESEQLAAVAAAEEEMARQEAAAAAAAAEAPGAWSRAAAEHVQVRAEAEAGAALAAEAARRAADGAKWAGLASELRRSLSGRPARASPRLHQLAVLSRASLLAALAAAAGAVPCSPATILALLEAAGKPHGSARSLGSLAAALFSSLSLFSGAIAGLAAVERLGRRRTLRLGAAGVALGGLLLAVALLVAGGEVRGDGAPPPDAGCAALRGCGECVAARCAFCAHAPAASDAGFCMASPADACASSAARAARLHLAGCPGQRGALGLARLALCLMSFAAAAGPVPVALTVNSEAHRAANRGAFGGAAVACAAGAAAAVSALLRAAAAASAVAAAGAVFTLAVAVAGGAAWALASPSALPETAGMGTYLQLQAAYGHALAAAAAGEEAPDDSPGAEGEGRLRPSPRLGGPRSRSAPLMLPYAAQEAGAAPTLTQLASAFLADAGGGGFLPRGSADGPIASWWSSVFGPPAAAPAAAADLRSLILPAGGGAGAGAGGASRPLSLADERLLEREAGRLLAVEAPGVQTFPGFQRLMLPGEEAAAPVLSRSVSSVGGGGYGGQRS